MKTIYKGTLLNVFIKKQKLPHGFVATYEMIQHPGASLVVPFLARDRIIMLRQLRPVIGSYIYELPAGTLAKDEKPLACARREIVEETGYAAGRLTFLGKIYPVPGYSTERIWIYKAEGLRRRLHTPEADEVIRSIVMTKAQVRRLFKGGRITDGKTIAALAFCGWL